MYLFHLIRSAPWLPALALVLLMAASAWSGGPNDGDDEAPGMTIEVDSSILAGIAVEDGNNARMHTFGNEYQVSYQHPLAGGTIGIGVEYGHTHFFWNEIGDLPFGNGRDDPWNTLHMFSLDLSYSRPVYGKWSVMSVASVSSGFEKEMNQSFEIEGMLGLGYAPNKRWNLWAGVMASWHPTGASILPAAGVTWSSSAIEGLVVNVGMPETFVLVPVYRTLSLKAYGGMDAGTYRLADDSTVARKGYVDFMAINTGVDLVWNPCDYAELGLGFLYQPWGVMTLYDDDGDEIEDYTMSNGLGGRFMLALFF